jgi:hypothetical protein
MEQESAIDWFFLWFIDNPKGTHEEYLEAYDKAKAMEKEQIMNAFLQGKINHDKDWAIEYYNETYSDGKKN